MKKRLFGLISAAILVLTATPFPASAEGDSAAYPLTGKTPDGSYDYEVIKSGDQGTIFFDGAETDGGAFTCKWDSVYDVTFSKGHDIREEQKSYRELGSIDCDYTIEYATDGVSQYGIHGWVESKESFDCGTAEWIIVDGYSTWRPCTDVNGNTKLLGQVCIDDYKYEIYKVCLIPSLDAPTDRSQVIYQYLSVVTPESNPVNAERVTNVSRKISITDHFRAWEEAGIDMSGMLYDVSFWVVCARSSGEASVTKNEITIGDHADADYRHTGKTPDGRYHYEVWNEKNQGEIQFDGALVDGGAYSCRWDDILNCIFRKGRSTDTGRDISYKALGDISCTYSMNYCANGVSYYGIHGWIRDAKADNGIIEYNIVDGYCKWRPPGNAEIMRQILLDGKEYIIYRSNVNLSEDPESEYRITQYWSVTTDAPINEDQAISVKHTVSVDQHFKEWEKAGLDMSGTLTDISFQIFNYQSDGYAEVKQNNILFSSIHVPEEITPSEFVAPEKPDSFTGGTGDTIYRNAGATPDGSFEWYAEAMNQDGLGDTAITDAEAESGVFSCKWNSAESCYFQKGSVMPETQPYQAFRSIDCDYEIAYSPQGISCYGIHGWMEYSRNDGAPKTELYIVDGFSAWRPNDGAEPIGSSEIDGAVYDIYYTVKSGIGAPIHQYWSVIRSGDHLDEATALSRRISIDQHFRAWEDAGLDMSGKICELSFFVEGWYSSGEISVKQNDLIFGADAGDINGNGTLGHDDALLLRSYLMGEAAQLECQENADLNGDGILNALDLTLLKQKLL